MKWAAAVVIAVGIGVGSGLPAWGEARNGFAADQTAGATIPVPPGVAAGSVSGIRTHWLGGQSRSFLIPDASGTVWLRRIRPQVLERSVQTCEIATTSTWTRVDDQLVPANFLHDLQTAQLDVTVKRIRAKTFWEKAAGWVAPLVTVALAVGLALALPASGLIIAGTAAAVIAIEMAGAWVSSHPGIRAVNPLATDAAALSVSYAKLVQAQQAWKLAGAIASVRSNGVELRNGADSSDLGRVQGDFVFSDVHQRVPYTFMVVSPQEELPFDGTDLNTERSLTTVRDPDPPPVEARMVERVAIPGYTRQEFPGYLDPAAGLIALQEGELEVQPQGCQFGRQIAVSRAVAAKFEPKGAPAFEVKPVLSEVRTAGLLTAIYGNAELGTVRTRTEAVLPRAVPYHITNHIVIASDVLVLHRRKQRFGWPGCRCGQFGCMCWSQPYGTVAHRTFTVDLSDRGVYYDADLAASALDAYYHISGGKALGAQVARLAHIETRTRTVTLDPRPVGLLRTIWRTRPEPEVFDELVPASLYAQPRRPGEIPPSWGPLILADSGSWSGASQALRGCPEGGSAWPPGQPPASSGGSLAIAAPSPGPAASFRASPARNLTGVGFQHRSLAFSTGAERGLLFRPQMRQIEALSRSHAARHGRRERPSHGTLAPVQPPRPRSLAGHARPGAGGRSR